MRPPTLSKSFIQVVKEITSFVFSQWEVDRKYNEVSERWEQEFSSALEKKALIQKKSICTDLLE